MVMMVVILPLLFRAGLAFRTLIFAFVSFLRGLSSVVEATWESARSAAAALVCELEAPATRESTTEAAAASSSTASHASHHAEEDLWVDSTSHSATAAEHIGRVHQIISAIITSSFPAIQVST